MTEQIWIDLDGTPNLCSWEEVYIIYTHIRTLRDVLNGVALNLPNQVSTYECIIHTYINVHRQKAAVKTPNENEHGYPWLITTIFSELFVFVVVVVVSIGFKCICTILE